MGAVGCNRAGDGVVAILTILNVLVALELFLVVLAVLVIHRRCACTKYVAEQDAFPPEPVDVLLFFNVRRSAPIGRSLLQGILPRLALTE